MKKTFYIDHTNYRQIEGWREIVKAEVVRRFQEEEAVVPAFFVQEVIPNQRFKVEFDSPIEIDLNISDNVFRALKQAQLQPFVDGAVRAVQMHKDAQKPVEDNFQREFDRLSESVDKMQSQRVLEEKTLHRLLDIIYGVAILNIIYGIALIIALILLIAL